MSIVIRKRGYLHFDRPFFGDDALAAVSKPSLVTTWAFMPFIHVDLVSAKVKKLPDGSLKLKEKIRPIYYASHRDAALYYYYSEIMGEAYEAMLERLDISDCVTAFRKNPRKCNIDYAFEVFQYILLHEVSTVNTFDISSFFENLDHIQLKHQWASLLGVQTLPLDHYKIFKSLTQYSFVDRDEAYRIFGIGTRNHLNRFRERICDPSDFRKYIRDAGLIQKHLGGAPKERKGVGIPQGSPISALLSNLYMVEFDVKVKAEIAKVGGMYRRYCDDIICIVPGRDVIDVQGLIGNLAKKLGLAIHPEKSTIHHFHNEGGHLLTDFSEKNVQYLGFIFDGSFIRLRSAAMSRYYGKMRRGVRLANRVRMHTDLRMGTRSLIKTKRLQKTYTYLGRNNFISYALRAARKMDSNAIRKQIKPHLGRFKEYLNYKNSRWILMPPRIFEWLQRKLLR